MSAATATDEAQSTSQAGSGALTFRVATTLNDVLEAWSLVYDAYRRLDLIDPNPWGVHFTSHALTNDTAIIRGDLNGQCVTTMTGHLDHPDHGLPLDAVYPDELATLRCKGCNLVEVGLFADRRSDLRRTRTTLLDLMRWATYFGLNHGARHAVIGVHPHHARFYTKCLGFEIIGEEKSYGLVNDAPVVPLFLDWHNFSRGVNVPRGIERFINDGLPKEAYSHHSSWRSTDLTATVGTQVV